MMMNDEPLLVGRVYQKRDEKGNPFKKEGYYIIASKNGFVQYHYIWKDGECGISRSRSDTNRCINMLYELSDLEYDIKKKEWVS